MREATLVRFNQSEQGTQGVLFIDSERFCYTLELPWLDNRKSISCIPTGKYKCVPWKFHGCRKCFHLLNVPNRTNILIHSGNFAGDKRLGFRTNVEGCILVGKYFGTLREQMAILCSRITLRRLVEYLNWDIFNITIIDITETEVKGDKNHATV